MTARRFRVIQNVGVPKGSDEFEVRRQAVIAAFASKVPIEYCIPGHYIDSPPRDVSHIPRECGILTPEELEITENYDAFGLANAIALKKYTAVAVAKAFSKRAIICHQITNCLTQWFPEMAEQQATALDKHLKETGKTVGPLHGVPISIKQHIAIAGTYSDGGFLALTGLSEKDSLMVSILRKLGAVFYVKTAQPQAIMHLESDSYLGRVLNPFNINLSAGGSTGGESALIALRGSVMGIGTDIGGSVRGPSGKCGIYGFKPTTYTLPTRDYIVGGFPAELNILGSTGPMCQTLRDLDWFMHLVLGERPHIGDPRVVPIPWTGLQTPLGRTPQRPLKVGVMWSDGEIEPQPPVRRAMKWAVDRLSSSSLIDLKPYSPLRPAEAIAMIRQMYWPDGGNAIRALLAESGEPMHPLTEHIIRDAAGPSKDALEITAARVARDAFRSDFSEHWSAQDVDVVLCPMHVGPAPVHDTSLYWNYTALWNFVDYPGVVFPTPIRTQKRDDEPAYESATPLGEHDAQVRRLWQENDYEGAPIALQLVSRKHFDNLLIAALGQVKEILDLP